MFFEAVPAPAPPVPPVPPVPAADGHIEIRPGSAGAQTLWAMAEVAVSGQDVENIQLSLQPAMKVAGRIVFEATTITPPADLSRTQVTLQPVAPLPFNSTVPRAVVQPDGSFIVNGLMPGKYRLSATAPSAPSGQPAQWGLKSVSMGGVEALDAPIDLFRDDLTSAVITFTDRIASFTGVILDGKEQPVVGINVLLFSTDRTFWGLNSRRVLSRRSLAEGKFSFFNVPPGEYYLVTMADITQNDWQAPAMLEQLAGVAFKLTIDEGQKLNMPLKFAGGN
jgi:hypothetical protein